VNVAEAPIERYAVIIFEIETLDARLTESKRYVCLVIVTVEASVAEIVTNFDFNCSRDTVDARVTESDLNIEVIALPRVTVKGSDALSVRYQVVNFEIETVDAKLADMVR
jgi:hypothetical protein